jgi:hypothetical protein
VAVAASYAPDEVKRAIDDEIAKHVGPDLLRAEPPRA